MQEPRCCIFGALLRRPRIALLEPPSCIFEAPELYFWRPFCKSALNSANRFRTGGKTQPPRKRLALDLQRMKNATILLRRCAQVHLLMSSSPAAKPKSMFHREVKGGGLLPQSLGLRSSAVLLPEIKSISTPRSSA